MRRRSATGGGGSWSSVSFSCAPGSRSGSGQSPCSARSSPSTFGCSPDRPSSTGGLTAGCDILRTRGSSRSSWASGWRWTTGRRWRSLPWCPPSVSSFASGSRSARYSTASASSTAASPPAAVACFRACGKERLVQVVRLHADGLRLEEVDRPILGEGDVLVRVHAAAITRDELEWPVDRLPAVPSYELSGVAVEDSDGFSAGEDVFALTPFDRDGVAADYALVPVEVLAPKPGPLSHIQAAALPMPGLSAWQALIVHGRLQAGDRVGVTGAHGGVGHVAVQLARSRGAALVEEGAPCDLLFDTVGGQALARWAGQAGRIVTIAAEAPGAHYFVVEPNHEQLLELARLVDTGDLWPEIDSVFPLAQAQAAFMRSAARGKHGKVVLGVIE